MNFKVFLFSTLVFVSSLSAFPSNAEAPVTTMRPVERGAVSKLAPRRTSSDLIQKSKLSGDVSYVLIDVTSGEPLAERDATRFQPPASVTKAITAAYALEKLGTEHRFETRILHTGEIVDGVVKGDLILVGGADPVLETDNLVPLAEALRSAGIWKIEGSFIVTGGDFPRLFQIDPTQPPQVGYNPAVSGLNLNFNRIRFDWARKPNGKYRLTMQATGNEFAPDTPVSRIVTEPRELPVYSHRLRGETEEWSVSRPALGKEGGRWLPTRVPELYAGEAFAAIARSMGVQMPVPQHGVMPSEAKLVARHESPDLTKMLSDMLRFSTNLTAEVMGFRSSKEPDLPSSARALTSWSQSWGIGGSFADHSGLNDQSRVTAQGLANFMVSHTDRGLRSVLRKIPLKNKAGAEIPGIFMQAKTGSLNFVSTLSGYLLTETKTFAFAIVTSDLRRRGAIKPEDRERPAGGGVWAKKSRSLQFDLLRLWVENYGS